MSRKDKKRTFAGRHYFRATQRFVIVFAATTVLSCKQESRNRTEDCKDGSIDCACYSDNTCDPVDGTPVSCIANVCTSSEGESMGALGGACNPDQACGKHSEGILDCIDGMCELAGCPSGYLGCPCGPYGSCDDYFEVKVGCNADGRCEVTDCEPGSAGCECDDKGDCAGELVCTDDLCTGLTYALTIAEDSVRACDILAQHHGAKIASVRFNGALIGEYRSKAPRTAFSFVGRGDEALLGKKIRVELTSKRELAATSVSCYDGDGIELDEKAITVERE